jgi:hypothetical protein
MKTKPCKGHKACYPSLDIPEVKHIKYKLTMCLKCKWFVEMSN